MAAEKFPTFKAGRCPIGPKLKFGRGKGYCCWPRPMARQKSNKSKVLLGHQQKMRGERVAAVKKFWFCEKRGAGGLEFPGPFLLDCGKPWPCGGCGLQLPLAARPDEFTGAQPQKQNQPAQKHQTISLRLPFLHQLHGNFLRALFELEFGIDYDVK